MAWMLFSRGLNVVFYVALTLFSCYFCPASTLFSRDSDAIFTWLECYFQAVMTLFSHDTNVFTQFWYCLQTVSMLFSHGLNAVLTLFERNSHAVCMWLDCGLSAICMWVSQVLVCGFERLKLQFSLPLAKTLPTLSLFPSPSRPPVKMLNSYDVSILILLSTIIIHQLLLKHS